MIGLPSVERRDWQESMAAVLRDKGSRGFTHPAGYMFTHTPDVRRDADSIDRLLFEMDRFGIERGLVPVNLDDGLHVRALCEHPDRLLGSVEVDPNRGMEAVRDLVRAVEHHGIVAAQYFPAGKNPPVPINDKRAYVIYAKCVELDIPVFVQGGVPGPRVPMAAQHPWVMGPRYAHRPHAGVRSGADQEGGQPMRGPHGVAHRHGFRVRPAPPRPRPQRRRDGRLARRHGRPTHARRVTGCRPDQRHRTLTWTSRSTPRSTRSVTVDRATLLTAAQLVGLGRRCLDMSVAYARERH